MSEERDAKSQSRAQGQSRPQGRLKLTLLICMILVALGGGAVVLIFSTEPTARREGAVRESAMLVDVTHGEFGRFRPTIEVMGSVRAAREVSLRSRVQGEVIDMSPAFAPGAFVDQGQNLLALDPSDFEIALRQRQTELEQALSELAIERGEQQAAEAEYRQFNRDLPEAQRALVLRQPQLRAAQARVDSARASVDQARLNLDRANIAAPFDAHVITREVNLGSQVAPGDVLGRLVGTEAYWIEAAVPVAKLPWLTLPGDDEAAGALVEIRNRRAWQPGETRQGRMIRVIGELAGETRLARVLVAVDDPLARQDPGRPRLMLGEYVDCRIQGRELADVVRINRDYIRKNDTIWLMIDQRLVIRSVEIAFQDADYAYIRDGLTAEDAVVTTRLATVEEGVRLRVDEAEADAGERQ